jgi:hypothetical protein
MGQQEQQEQQLSAIGQQEHKLTAKGQQEQQEQQLKPVGQQKLAWTSYGQQRPKLTSWTRQE